MEEYITHSYDETIDLAVNFAKTLEKGSVVAYFGGLGMGKTAFTLGLAKGLGIDCDVCSPTFTLCNTYVGEDITLHHFDMYRVDSWDDLYSTGFFDLLDSDCIIAVEWSENIFSALPENSVIVEIERLGETTRKFKIYSKLELEE